MDKPSWPSQCEAKWLDTLEWHGMTTIQECSLFSVALPVYWWILHFWAVKSCRIYKKHGESMRNSAGDVNMYNWRCGTTDGNQPRSTKVFWYDMEILWFADVCLLNLHLQPDSASRSPARLWSVAQQTVPVVVSNAQDPSRSMEMSEHLGGYIHI